MSDAPHAPPPAPRGEPDEYGPDVLGALATAVRRHPRWVIVPCLLGALLGLLTGMLRPNTFSSESSLLLRLGARERITSETLAGEDSSPVTLPTMLDELQMLSDVKIYESVARAVGPYDLVRPEDPTLLDDERTSWPIHLFHLMQKGVFALTAPEPDCANGDCDACVYRATKALVDRTTVTNELGSNVIKVVHVATSPEQARRINQALLDAFVERHKQQFSVEALLEKHRGELDRARHERDEAATAYFQHLSNTDFVDLETQYPAFLEEINELEDQLFTVRLRREEIAWQLETRSQDLEGGATGMEMDRPALVVPNDKYLALQARKRELMRTRWKLGAAGLSAEDRAARQRELDGQIDKLNRDLVEMPTSFLLAAPGTENPAQPEALSVNVEVLQREDRALSMQGDLLEKRLADIRTRLATVTKQGQMDDYIRKDLAAAKESKAGRYQHMLDRFSRLEALVSIDLDEVNLQPLTSPTYDPQKHGPKRASLLLQGLLGGLAAGLAFAALRSRLDGRRDASDAAGAARAGAGAGRGARGGVGGLPRLDPPAPRP